MGTLCIDIPEGMTITSLLINGHAVEAELIAGEYTRLSAEWQNGDVITLTFPADFTATLTDNNSVSIRRGAVLFALEIGEKWKKISYNPLNWNLTREYRSYDITPTTDWNYALENFNFDDVASNFTVTRNPITDQMQYQLSDAPIILEAKVRAVKDWVLNTDYYIAGDTPISPVSPERLEDETVTVRLVPYSHTRLHITLMPWTGDAQDAVAERVDDNTLLFPSLIIPLEQKGASVGNAVFSYTMNLSYRSPVDLVLKVEINRKDAGTVTLAQGAGTVTLETDLLGTDRHNRVVFFTEDGSVIPTDLTLSASVRIHDVGIIHYEAEKAKLKGSAYSAGTHVAGIDDPGSSLTFENLFIAEDGDYTLRFYYAAPTGLATHTVYIDGVKRGTLRYNENGKSLGWGSFDQDIYADIHLTLEKGTHTLRIEKTKSDIGFAELESFDRLPCSLTGGTPQPIPDED